MTLTPEQEALVEEVACAVWRETYRHDTLLVWQEIKRGTLHQRRTLDAARAIIPLIYAAGRRAGREEAAVVADEMANGARVLHNAASADRDLDGMNIHGEAWRYSKHIATAIRNLSEQESGCE